MKLTDAQRFQIRAIRKVMVKESRYVPRGQGDGINQHLKIRQFRWLIDQIKAGNNVHMNLVDRGIM